ncbi:MAG: response regulator [Verrucomicrobia bacterium]|nr:response regulator [Verrucomicrobiota bacterium]
MPTAEPLVAVLDDEPEMRKALRRLLVCCGFRVAEYEGGEDFLAALDAAPPDCLLLDLHMPEVNGFGVLEALRSRHPPLPTVVITAHDQPGTEERVQALGACAYLKKPVDRDALLAAIATATANPALGEKLETLEVHVAELEFHHHPS